MATIVVGTNSYVTVAEAEAFAADGGDSFTGDVSVMLIKSMRYLNLQDWSGTKTDPLQALDFPRNGDTNVPEDIKQAQIVIALTYDGGADLLAPVERAVKEDTVDVITTIYMDNAATSASYPYINALIGVYLSSNALTGGNTFDVYKGLH
jgi:hypothetical protein